MNLIEGENAKICTICEELKSFGDFYKTKTALYGVHNWCKDCYSKKYKRKRKIKKLNNLRTRKRENNVSLVEGINSKFCSCCEKLVLFENFHKQKAGRFGLQPKCIFCLGVTRRNTIRKTKRKNKTTKLLNGSIERNWEEFQDKLKQSKFCTVCDKYKSWNEFRKRNSGRYGLRSSCKKCDSDRANEWRKNNLEKSRKYFRDRYANNESYRIRRLLSGRIRQAIKNNIKTKKTEELLGISIEEFKDYLESQFKEGMSWDNQGDWHIDHIIPCARFDLSKPHHQEECFFYTNMQPLWAEENLKKNDKY